MKPVTLQDLHLPTNLPLPGRKDWRIGVIGLGGISRAHLPAYRAAGWSVIAASDLDPSRRHTARADFGIASLHEDYRSVIDDPRVEVISLLTQPSVREEIVAACAAAGKPLLTEKPLALDLSACERMVRIADAAGVLLAVNQNYRWLPSAFAARNLIAAGWIGRPYFTSIEIHGTQDRELAEHPFYSRCRDFLTVQWNSHLADLVRGFMNRDPQRVLARTSRMPGQAFAADNLLTSLMDFGPEGTGLIVHNELHRGGLKANQIRIEGELGTLVFPLWSNLVTLRSERLGSEPVSVDCAPAGFLDSFAGPMADLLISLETGREPEISARRNLATIRQILAEDASARNQASWQELHPAAAESVAKPPASLSLLAPASG